MGPAQRQVTNCWGLLGKRTERQQDEEEAKFRNLRTLVSATRGRGQHTPDPEEGPAHKEVAQRPSLSLLTRQGYKGPWPRRPHTCQPPSAPAPAPLTHPTLTNQNHGLLWLRRGLWLQLWGLRLQLWGLRLRLWGLWPQLLCARLLL